MASSQSFETIHESLLQQPAPLLPPARVLSPALTAAISSLQLHPTLEAALHILNRDLPSAHFLVRHMQSPPAYEGMYLHGILHRIEGDYDNARYWYSDVKPCELYAKVWGSEGKSFKAVEGQQGNDDAAEKDAGQKFIDRVQMLKEGIIDAEGERKDLEQMSRQEIEVVVGWCVERFGTDRMLDATSAWVKNSEEIHKMSDDQITGDAGRRKF